MFHWNSRVWENTLHCLINAVKKCLLLYLSPECQTQDLKCLQIGMSWMGKGNKEHGLWGQTDQAWTLSLPGGFDLGSYLRTPFYTTDDNSEGGPRMRFPAFMRNCMYQYVMGSLRASLHARCKDLERGLRYSQGDSGTEEWREGRLERQYLNYSPEHVFYEWMVSQVKSRKGRPETRTCSGVSMVQQPWQWAYQAVNDGISHPANLSPSVSFAAKQPSSDDLGSS